MDKKKILLWSLPMAFFCVLGLFFFSLTGYNFSGLICFAIAGCIFLYWLFWRFPAPFTRWARRIFTALLAIGLLLAGITGIFIGRAAAGSKEDDCDYLIVLGAAVHGTVPSLSLRERLDAAYDYLAAHPDTVCVVSGGQGDGELISEAACMSDFLVKKGICPERILLEDKATSTQENLRFSLDVIEEATGTRPAKVGIISSEYHLYRASLMAQSQGLEPVLVPATTTWVSLRVNYFMREIAGVWYYIIFGG